MANETNEVNVTGGSVRTGKTVDVTLRITAKDLWMFSMYHANAGFMGMFNLIFSLAALYLLIFRWSTTTVPYRCLLVVCALIFTVWQPFLLWNKARKQAKRPAVKNPMRLIFDDEKLTVSQEENSADFTWEQMGRLDAKSSMYILYMDRVHAYLIPKETLGEQEETFRELVTAHLPKSEIFVTVLWGKLCPQ